MIPLVISKVKAVMVLKKNICMTRETGLLRFSITAALLTNIHIMAVILPPQIIRDSKQAIQLTAVKILQK